MGVEVTESDRLTKALKRIDELERAMATYEASNPDLFELKQQLNGVRSARDDILVCTYAKDKEISSIRSSARAWEDRALRAEHFCEKMSNARSEDELHYLYDSFKRSNDLNHDNRWPPGLANPYIIPSNAREYYEQSKYFYVDQMRYPGYKR